eukprot:18299-Heterococcus_DN1.PRE.6
MMLHIDQLMSVNDDVCWHILAIVYIRYLRSGVLLCTVAQVIVNWKTLHWLPTFAKPSIAARPESAQLQ